VLRIACLLLIDYLGSPIADQQSYELAARNIIEHHIFSRDDRPPFEPTIMRPPGFPAAIALVYTLFGYHFLAFQFLQLTLSLLTGVLMALCAARLAPRLAPMVLWFTMLSPFDAIFSGALLPETLSTLFVVLAFILPVCLRRRRIWLAAGIAMGFAALTRDIYLGLPIFAGIAMALGAWAFLSEQKRLQCAGMLLGGAILVVLPWTARNYVVSGRIVPVSEDFFGWNLWIGTWETNDVKLLAINADEDLWRTVPAQAFLNADEKRIVKANSQQQNEAEWDRAFVSVAVHRIKAEPFQVMLRYISRSWHLWLGTREPFLFRPPLLAAGSPGWVILKGGLFGLNTTIVVLAAWGIVQAFRFCRRMLWFAIPIAYSAIVYFPFHTEVRYSQPVYPFILLFAAVTLSRQLFGFEKSKQPASMSQM
jgi:4-amino-4-deoxy-L-arabinose transferase-like glycosyltransferase